MFPPTVVRFNRRHSDRVRPAQPQRALFAVFIGLALLAPASNAVSEDRARGAQARGDYSAGSYYIKGEVEDHVNEYTTKLRISRSSGGWAGLIWSGTPDSFALRLSGLQVDGRGFRYRVRAIGPGGEILAVKACRADFKGNPDVLPYECLFETGPPGIRGKVQTGFLIRDRGQRIVKYRVPAQPVRFCFIDTVRDE